MTGREVSFVYVFEMNQFMLFIEIHHRYIFV